MQPSTSQKTGSSKKPHSPPRFKPEPDEVKEEENTEVSNSKKSGKKQKKKTADNKKVCENDTTPTEQLNSSGEATNQKKPKATNQTETTVTSQAPPPGFEALRAQSHTTPLLAGPPPGFAAAESFPSFPAPLPIKASADYIKPFEYETRNQELKSKLTELFDKKAFNEFMSLSIEFRNSQMNAEDYLDRCQSLLDFRFELKP